MHGQNHASVLAVGDRVLALRGTHAGERGAVQRTTKSLAFVRFESADAVSGPVSRKHRRTLRKEDDMYGNVLPSEAMEQIMSFVHADHAAGVMPAAHTCRRWRQAVIKSAWVQPLDLTANGSSLCRRVARDTRRRSGAHVPIDVELVAAAHVAPPVPPATRFCRWMLDVSEQLSPAVSENLTQLKLVLGKADECLDQVGLLARIVLAAPNLRELQVLCPRRKHADDMPWLRAQQPAYDGFLRNLRNRPLVRCDIPIGLLHGGGFAATLATLTHLEELTLRHPAKVRTPSDDEFI